MSSAVIIPWKADAPLALLTWHHEWDIEAVVLYDTTHIVEFVRGQVLHSMVNHIQVPDQTTITMVIDENGVAALPVNKRATMLYDGPSAIHGNAVVVGLHKDMVEGWEPVDLDGVLRLDDGTMDVVSNVKAVIDYRLSQLGQ